MAKFKLLNYSQLKSPPRAGLLIKDCVYDLEAALLATEHSVNFDPFNMVSVLNEWDRVRPAIDFIETKVSIGLLDHIKKPLKDVELTAPLPNPGMFYSAEANYSDYLQEMTGNPEPNEPTRPFILTHATRASIIGPKENIVLPEHSQRIDWQAEIALIIGRRGKKIPREKAWDYVAGFTLVNNLSARDLTKRYDVPFVFDWFSLKSFDSSTPMGPWITPTDDIPNPNSLSIKLWVNKSLKQDSSTDNMIVCFEGLISYISERVTLFPGDLIATGTPAGCGAIQKQSLKDGDLVRIEVDGLGELINPVLKTK